MHPAERRGEEVELDEQLVDEGERFRTPQQVREEAPFHGRAERVVVDVELERDEIIFAGGVLEPLEDVFIIARRPAMASIALRHSTQADRGPPAAEMTPRIDSSSDRGRRAGSPWARLRRSAAHARIAYALAGSAQSATREAGASSAATTLAARRKLSICSGRLMGRGPRQLVA